MDLDQGSEEVERFVTSQWSRKENCVGSGGLRWMTIIGDAQNGKMTLPCINLVFWVGGLGTNYGTSDELPQIYGG